MSDDEDDKGKKTNASPEHIPKNVAQDGAVPTGSIGRKPAGLSGPGLGSSSRGRVRDQTSHQPQAGASQPTKAEPAKDDSIGFPETDDPAVNADHQKRERMISKESREHPDHPQHGVPEQKAEGPKMTQSDYAQAFRRARDRTRQIQNDKGHELD